MLKLLYKTLGMSFYQQHAGLFLVVLYLLFGAVESSQLVSYHRAILMAICSSPVVLGALLLIWLLYAVKAFFFVKKKLEAPEYLFTALISSISAKMQYRVWVYLYVFLLLPLIIYAIAIVIVSLKIGAYATMFFTLFGLMGLILVPSAYTVRLTNRKFLMGKVRIALPEVKMRKPFWSWSLFYLLAEQRIALLIVKCVSIFFLKAVLFMFADVGEDIRVYLTAVLAVTLSHAVLVFNLVKFNAFYLAFSATLPLSVFRNLINAILVYAILVLPELVLLSWLKGFVFLHLLQYGLFAMAMMLVMQLIVYLQRADMERYLKSLLFFFFASMMAILAGHAMVYSVLLIAISIFLFLWRYPKVDLKTIA